MASSASVSTSMTYPILSDHLTKYQSIRRMDINCRQSVIASPRSLPYGVFMTNKLILSVAAAATLALAVPAYAQSSAKTDKGAVISVQGGGLTSVADLNDAK